MDLLVATTPSPASGIHTPPTPKHGYEDSWKPYSPRKSARLAQRANNRTPSPQPTHRRSDPRNHSLGSPRSKKKPSTTMASPATSPQKKRVPATDGSRRASGTLTAESTAHAAAALGLPGKTESRPARSAMTSGARMLPTPAKTPQKPPSEKSKANVRSIARSLFHSDEEVMPTPSKSRGKKHVLDSFAVDDVEAPISIFTDSHERIPEIDTSADNPFYGPQTIPTREPAKRRSKRQEVSIPGEGKVTVEEAVRREDGMLTVFRGKKQFRKFADIDEVSGNNSEGADEAGGVLANDASLPSRRLTRSSIKPRLLFPVNPEEGADAMDDDEEALTDIEDCAMAKTEGENPQTPTDLLEEAPDTPVAPKFAPASPPTTNRTTRHGNKAADETTPMKPRRGGKRSPFDGWRRVKNPSAESHGQKRSGDTLTADPPKRTRA